MKVNFLLILSLAAILTKFEGREAFHICECIDRYFSCSDESNEGFSPVMGFDKNGGHKPYTTGCQACHDDEIKFYRSLMKCPKNRTKFNITSTIRKSCAVTKKGLLFNMTNVTNPCESEYAEYFFMGECPFDKGHEKHVCTAKERSVKYCKYISKPVCSKYNDSKGNITYRTILNKCHACREKHILSYTKGKCILNSKV